MSCLLGLSLSPIENVNTKCGSRREGLIVLENVSRITGASKLPYPVCVALGIVVMIVGDLLDVVLSWECEICFARSCCNVSKDNDENE